MENQKKETNSWFGYTVGAETYKIENADGESMTFSKEDFLRLAKNAAGELRHWSGQHKEWQETTTRLMQEIPNRLFADVTGKEAFSTVTKCEKILEMMQDEGIENIDDAWEALSYTGAYIGQRKPWLDKIGNAGEDGTTVTKELPDLYEVKKHYGYPEQNEPGEWHNAWPNTQEQLYKLAEIVDFIMTIGLDKKYHITFDYDPAYPATLIRGIVSNPDQ